jgi:hypothetical protein
MRAAQLDKGIVVNFIEVASYTAAWVDPKNAVLGSIWNGQEFFTPVPPAVVPAEISMRRFRLSLHGAGWLVDLQSAIDAMAGADGELLRIDWVTSPVVERDSRLSATLAAMGKTRAEIDVLFIAAAAMV